MFTKVMHGGLFSKDGISLDDIRTTDRNRQPPEEGIMCELLWSDPQPMKGRSPSKRGDFTLYAIGRHDNKDNFLYLHRRGNPIWTRRYYPFPGAQSSRLHNS